MAKQTFTTGQVLSAAQVNALQANDYNTTVSTKTASYVLVAADVGTTIVQNVATNNTVTVNTGLFAAGDTLRIQNIGVGIALVSAGTATVNTANSLALPQWGSGILYFTSASAAIFFPSAGAAAAGGGKVLQVVQGSTASAVTISSTTYTDTGLTATITPSLSSSRILVMVSQQMLLQSDQGGYGVGAKILRASTLIVDNTSSSVGVSFIETANGANGRVGKRDYYTQNYLDSPATTSATIYKVQMAYWLKIKMLSLGRL